MRLSPGKPEVPCDTITNVRVTDRAIEETIRLDFDLQNAGMRRVSFLLPDWMAGSRISVPMLRQKTVEPVGKTGLALRVAIELQDEVIGPTPRAGRERPAVDARLARSADSGREETGGNETVPIFRMNHRMRDRERRTRRSGAGGGHAARNGSAGPAAEAVGEAQGDPGPRDDDGLSGRVRRPAAAASFHTQTHAAVATVKARIGLAETKLVVDANGAYRGELALRVDNATEQFLDIRLPEGGTLWTAAWPASRSSRRGPRLDRPARVRIPLIKTAPGELAYRWC